MNLENLRHEKEKTYFTFCAIISVIAWLIILIGTMGLALIWIVILAIPLWISQQIFKVNVFGNSIKVNENQYPDLYKIFKEKAAELQLQELPDIFLINSNGAMNAIAVKFISSKYVILYSSLVDLMLKRNEIEELTMIISHELAHHAAGHISLGKNLLIYPSKIIPFLGAAYGRACEFTADKIGAHLTKNKDAAKRALVSLSGGSEALSSNVNIEEFKKQEYSVPGFFGFLVEIFSSHPRMTKRIIEIDK